MAYFLYLLRNLDLFLPDITKKVIKLLNISVQNKQNKKDTFFSNPKFWLFGDFLKLEVFPEENPTQKLANSLEPRRNWFTDLSFVARNSQIF